MSVVACWEANIGLAFVEGGKLGSRPPLPRAKTMDLRYLELPSLTGGALSSKRSICSVAQCQDKDAQAQRREDVSHTIGLTDILITGITVRMSAARARYPSPKVFTSATMSHPALWVDTSERGDRF